MGDPVGESEASTRSQHAMCLAKGAREVWYMEQSFLAYDRILALVRQWQGGDISLDHLNLPVQPNTPYQLRSSCNPRRRQFDAGGKRAVAMRQISGRAAETSTQVDDLGAGADMRALGLGGVDTYRIHKTMAARVTTAR